MPSIGSRMTRAAPRLGRPGETRTFTSAESAEFDQLEGGPTCGASGDDHRADFVDRADRGDVVHRAQNWDPVHDLKARPSHFDESTDAVSHPWAALKRARQGPGFVVGPGNQRELAGDRASVESMRQPARHQPAGDDGDEAYNEERGDELPTRVGFSFERDQHDEQHRHDRGVDQTAQLRGCVGRTAQIVQPVDRKDHGPDRDCCEDDGPERIGAAGLPVVQVEDGPGEEIPTDNGHDVDGERGDGKDHGPGSFSRERRGLRTTGRGSNLRLADQLDGGRLGRAPCGLGRQT